MWGDLEEILELERRIAEAPHWNSSEYEEILGASDGEVRRKQEGVWRCLLVAKYGGRHGGFAVGSVVFCGENVDGELESVAVAPEVRRGGVGRALCGAVLSWCAEHGANSVALEVRRGSAAAIALYRGLGFRETGVRRRYYRDPEEDALLMGLDLDACGERALPVVPGAC